MILYIIIVEFNLDKISEAEIKFLWTDGAQRDIQRMVLVQQNEVMERESYEKTESNECISNQTIDGIFNAFGSFTLYSRTHIT